MKTIITDFFHVGVLPYVYTVVDFEPVSLDRAREICQLSQDGLFEGVKDCVESAVRHESNAGVFSGQLGIMVPCNRVTVRLQYGTQLLVGDYWGPELAEDAMELPKGAEIRWRLVTIE